MSKNCPVAGECIRASICEGFDDDERIIELMGKSPEAQIMKDSLTDEELRGLIAPVLQAWNSSNCYRARVQALKDLQYDDGISHVSMTMGLGVVEELEKSQLEL